MVDLSILGCLSFEEGGGGEKRGGQLPLELLGSLVLLDFRADLTTPAGASGFGGAIVGQTDAKGAMFCVSKLYSSAEPAASLVRSMAARCSKADVLPALDWEPRELNTWADDLSKEKVEGFTPARRHRVDWRRFADVQEDFNLFSGAALLRPAVA